MWSPNLAPASAAVNSVIRAANCIRLGARKETTMRGSLDDPPIVIRTARWKAVLHLGATGFMAAIAWPLFRSPLANSPTAWMLYALFGALVTASVWELVWPSRLVIGPDGFTARDLWRYRRWSWSEARHFAPAENRFYNFVGFNAVTPSEATRWPGGLDGLNQDWELAPPALAALLNQARERWFTAPAGPWSTTG